MQRLCRSVNGLLLAMLLAVAILWAAVIPIAGDAAAATRSDGLTTDGAQIWRQGENGLDGTAEGQVIAPVAEATLRRRGDDFGAELAAGDFNGDGVDDLAIAAPGENAVERFYDTGTSYDDLDPGRGAVIVIYGTKPGGLSAADNSDQFWTPEDLGLTGIEKAAFGHALETGDFDGDGYDDLAIGMPYAGSGGAVVVLYGSPVVGLRATRNHFFNQNTPGMEGVAEPGDRFGWALASGRFNDDPYDDLAIGIPGEDDDAGAVAVIYGSANGLSPFAGPGNQLLQQGAGGMSGTAEAEVIGELNEDKGDNFGAALAAGRFKPGPTDDLAIGVPGEILGKIFEGPGMSGAVHIVYSDENGLNPNGFYDDMLWHQDMWIKVNGVERYVHGNAEGGDGFGSDLYVGNFGHDFLDDLAIGIPGEDQKAGGVAILFGSVNGIHIYPYNDQFFDQNTDGIKGEAEGNTPRGGDEFGAALTAGDFNGDDWDDLAIGVPGEDDYKGAVNVIYGGPAGLAADAGPGNQLFEYDANVSERFGAAVEAGDFNGDGVDDLAIGVPYDSDHKGAVKVLYAAPPQDLSPPSVTPDISGILGDNGWYTSDVMVRWDVTEEESEDSLDLSQCPDTPILQDTDGTTATCIASSKGGTTEAHVVIKRDATPPRLDATFISGGQPYIGHTWATQPVVVNFQCDDAMSGLVDCPDPVTLVEDGRHSVPAGENEYVYATDAAGNEAGLRVSGIWIDRTPPETTATVIGDVYSDRGGYKEYLAGTPVVIELTAVDANGADGSGVAVTEYRVNGGGWTYAFVPIVLHSPHDYVVEFRSRDRAGNVEEIQTLAFAIVPADQEPPTITAIVTPAPNQWGWNNSDVTVTFLCDDNDQIKSCPDQVVVTDRGRNIPIRGEAEDAEGNKASTVVYVSIDQAAPISALQYKDGGPIALLGIRNTLDWYDHTFNGDRQLYLYLRADDPDFALGQPGSGVAYIEYRVRAGDEDWGDWQQLDGFDGLIPFDDGEYMVEYRPVDRAGNEGITHSIGFKIDQTPPEVWATVDPEPNEHGWHNGNVTVTFEGSDETAGLWECYSESPLLAPEGAGQIQTGTCVDRAGNYGDRVTVVVNIDRTAPIITATAETAGGVPYKPGSTAHEEVTVTFQCFDALSGMEACSNPLTFGEGENQLAVGTAVDRAGNTAELEFGPIHVDLHPTAPAVQVSPASLTVREGAAAEPFTVALTTMPVAEVTVTATIDGNDLSFNPDPPTLTFTPLNWNQPQSVEVAAVADGRREATEVVAITFAVASADPAYDGLAVADLPVTVLDGDRGGGRRNRDKVEDDGEGTAVPGGTSQTVQPDRDTTVTTGDDRLTIRVPQGAIHEEATITVTPLTEEDQPAPGAGLIKIVDQVFEILIVDAGGNSRTRFEQPLELVFSYDPDTLPEGVTEEDLQVFYWDEGLRAWILVPSERDSETGTIRAVVDHLTVFAVMAAPNLSVPQDLTGHWSADEVLKLVSLGIVRGFADGTYRPELNVTRAEFTRILAVAMGWDPIHGPQLDFVDPVPDWAAGYVAAAVEAGLVEGFPDGTFRPGEPITREQLAVMVVRALGVIESGVPSFDDAGEIADWAGASVATAVRLGLLTGFEDHTFRPHETATRAQAAAIIARLVERLPKARPLPTP